VVGKQAPQRVLVPVAVREQALVLVAALELVIGPAVVPELERGRVAALEQALVLVEALELVIGPAVVPELERGPVAAADLELVQVEAVPVPGHLRAQLAVALRTKSVTAAHRRGLVPVLAAEDLAAAAETTREPSAAEAATAWEVADSAAVAVAAVVVAAEGVGDEQTR